MAYKSEHSEWCREIATPRPKREWAPFLRNIVALVVSGALWMAILGGMAAMYLAVRG